MFIFELEKLAFLGIILLVLYIYIFIAFLVGTAKKDNSIMDIFYGGGFIVVAWTSFILNWNFGLRQIIVTILVTIWGFRLSIYVLIRNWGKGEDKRYQNMRERWGNNVIVNSLLRIYFFQGLVIFIVSFPVSYINISINTSLWFLDYIGIFVWIIGFLFESVGDFQLYNFLRKPENQGKVFDKGLWRYTQHPNYFGEVTQWWGIYIIALGVPWGILTFFGPLLINYMIINVSGVKLLNKRFEGDSEYARYKRRTSQFIPLPPKKEE
jgi:steroid 5-alpha reductase family enzyme